MGSDLTSKLDVGATDAECTFNKLKLVTQYLKILYRYKVPDYQILYLYAVSITNADGNSVSLTLSINGVTLGIYSGDESGSGIATYFKHYINETTSTPDYYAESVNGTLYIYGYTKYSYTTYYPYILNNSTGLEFTGYTKSSYEDDEDYILGVWNCLSNVQINNIMQHSLILLKNYDACSDLGLAFSTCFNHNCTSYTDVTMGGANPDGTFYRKTSERCVKVVATSNFLFIELRYQQGGSTVGIRNFPITSAGTYYFYYDDTYGWLRIAEGCEGKNVTMGNNTTGCSGCNN